MDRPPLNRRNELLAEEFTKNYQAEVRCGRCGLDQCDDCRSQTQENRHDETNPNLPTRNAGIPFRLDAALRLSRASRDLRQGPRPRPSTNAAEVRLVASKGRLVYCHQQFYLQPGVPQICKCGDTLELERR